MKPTFPALLLVLLIGPACGPSTGGGDEVSPLSCAEQHAQNWSLAAAPACDGGRTCLDPQGRWWLAGQPFIPRGLYNAGFEFDRVLTNCPAGEACEATTPANVEEYLEQMAAAGFNLIQERSLFVPELRKAVHAHPDVYFAHLLWSDPFTPEGHAALVAEIEEAAEDPDVVMWFGPDEVDMWDDWSTAAGIRRLLRGSSVELDGALSGAWSPDTDDVYLPATEPAHDPYQLPYGAALDATAALPNGSALYEALMPTIYPLTGDDSDVDGAYWGTARVTTAAGLGDTPVPVLQMVGIGSMGLAQPTPEQITALIGSSMVHGAQGAFYYTYISDSPATAGRQGWYAPDDVEAFAAFTAMHSLQDALTPVTFADADSETDTEDGLEWRRWDGPERSVVLVVNARAQTESFDLADLLPEAQEVRHYLSCEGLTDRSLTLEGYELAVLEGW